MRHITDERLKYGKLSADELEHIANCNFCANRFILICEKQTAHLPLPVKERILKKSKIYTPSYKKQQEFRKYCIRVALSCAGSLALIITTKAFDGEKPKQPQERFIPGIVKYNQTKDEIKEFFTFKEDINNEKTK